MLINNTMRPGDHDVMLEGVVGHLEAVLTIPEHRNPTYVALLGHPHSLQGGTMNNKVVTTLVRVFKELGIASLRFNFRGVGKSQGVYDAGIGESEDMLLIANQLTQAIPSAQCVFAGFSFGSYVAYRAAAHHSSALLITVAPAVQHYDYQAFHPAPMPWILVQGDEDEVVPSDAVYAFAAAQTPSICVLRFPEATHFFHGQLIALKTRLMNAVFSKLAGVGC